MHTQQWILLGIMAVGGAAVIGSYIHGFSTHPGSANTLWGGVTGGLRTFNYVTMILAALGFFAFAFWLLLRADPDTMTVFGGSGHWMFSVIIAVILAASALWMPLLFGYLDQPGTGLWVSVRIVLVLVGIASLALVAALLTVSPRETGTAYWLAVAGAAAFSVQTAVMDMFIWPALFRE